MSTENRLVSVRRLLDHISERLALDFGFILWDGSTIPNSLAPGTLALCVADEGAIAALVRRPTLDTVLNLWVSGRLDLRNGDLFDLVARRPKVRTKDLLSTFKKRLILSVAANFLLVPRGGPWPLERLPKNPLADGSESALSRFGFEIHDVEGWREHYARTCRLWHDRLLANKSAAERQVGREKCRLWLAYLAGSAIGFERGSIFIFQTLASKRNRGSSGLPPTRSDLYAIRGRYLPG
jgi:hypothetical protein